MTVQSFSSGFLLHVATVRKKARTLPQCQYGVIICIALLGIGNCIGLARRQPKPVMPHLFCPKKTKQALEASPDLGHMSPSVQKLAEDGKLDHIYNIPLLELNCQFGIVRNRTDEQIPLQKAHGQQLAELVAEEPSTALLATVKETGADDEALLDFYEKYFARHAIYQDEKWKLYHAMGGRKIGIGKAVLGSLKSFRRYRAKKIQASHNITTVDTWMLGGVLIFDRQGILQHVVEEDFGEPLDVHAIKKVIEDIKKNQENKDTGNSASQLAEAGSESHLTES
ncbi:hypothetical protein FisN_6Lh286 [Fistulifera solaris]|uniref:Uncharacterized protein n=1 Tax=Fistulifera solaris TaxID=1519565 RepID=A0A1Z5J5S6_FISSO|nr:hypothetical protein FisN_6Lh286 [Fistulifera solaris]|eukprot:GAX09345.1 hypothetical protein FisN_6Lh286 [Fistulifera solaris]